jgi:hypothetical protein
MGLGIALSSILLYDPSSEHISRNSFMAEFHCSSQRRRVQVHCIR